MDDYKQYEQACQQIKKDNKALLKRFSAWLKASKLSAKTIDNHISNVDFYVNEYLLSEEAVEARDGADEIGLFLGDWFIRKATWSSAASIKANATSLKKFYTFMQAQGEIDRAALDDLKQTIKAEMPDWIDALKSYEDIDEDDMW